MGKTVPQTCLDELNVFSPTLTGIGPLAWTMNAELFAPEAKAVGAPIAYSFNWFSAFLVTRFYPDVESVLGTAGTYAIFAGVCVLGTFFSAFLVPETKGKTPAQIKAMFE